MRVLRQSLSQYSFLTLIYIDIVSQYKLFWIIATQFVAILGVFKTLAVLQSLIVIPHGIILGGIILKCTKEERFQIGNTITKLSQHQKLMLMIAAVKGFSQPTSKDVIQQMRASVGSAAKTFKFLLQQDYIYLGTDGFYKIVDPAVEAFLKRTAVTVIG